MNWRTLAVGFAFTAIFVVVALHPLRMARAADSGAPFVPDKGKFRILQNGNEVGTEEFELTPTGDAWMARGDTVIRGSDSGDMRSSGQLRLSADGTPLRYDWTAQTDKKITGFVDQ